MPRAPTARIAEPTSPVPPSPARKATGAPSPFLGSGAPGYAGRGGRTEACTSASFCCGMLASLVAKEAQDPDRMDFQREMEENSVWCALLSSALVVLSGSHGTSAILSYSGCIEAPLSAWQRTLLRVDDGLGPACDPTAAAAVYGGEISSFVKSRAWSFFRNVLTVCDVEGFEFLI